MKANLTVFSIFLTCIISGNIFSQNSDDIRWRQLTTQPNVTGNYTLLPQQDGYKNNIVTTKKEHTESGDLLIPPNVRPLPQAVTTESEVTGVTQYGNQNVMYAAWNSYGPAFYGTGFCFTNNGGLSWTGSTQMLVAGNNGDPAPWIWPVGSTWAGRLGIAVIGNGGIVSTYSTDNGTTWTPFVTISGSSPDKNLSCVDETSGSPYYGRVYTLWTDFGGTYFNRIVASYTTNGGASWTGYQPVSPVPPAGHHMQGCDVAVGPGGVVYAIWATCTTNGQNSTEDFLGFAKSTDGGVTWPVSNYNVVDINGIRAASFFNGIRVNGFPRIAVDHSGGPRNGWIYVVTSEKLIAPARDNSDVTMCRSTDGGNTWTHTLVNSDAAGNYNYMASVCVNQIDGNVAIGYYDQRNTTSPVTQYYVSWSANGGNSWADVQVSDHNFTPAPIPGLAGGYQGDYTGITYSNGKFFPFWMDNSSGVYNVWTCAMNPITLTHDMACGPFLALQSYTLIYTPLNVKVKVSNLGSTNESAVPVKLFINGVLLNTVNVNENAGQIDSISYLWTPTSTGTFNLMYVVSLATDQDRTNDTVRATVIVGLPLQQICSQLFCYSGITYTSISGGNPGPSGDDSIATVPIGFTFRWVAYDFTNLSICTNGYIQFGATGVPFNQGDLCGTSDFNIIAGFWDDLLAPPGSITYLTYGIAPYRVFVVQYSNVGYFSGVGNVTFQIWLFETYNSWQISYGPMINNVSASGQIGANVMPGGAGNVVSITPGSTCSNTSVSTTSCNHTTTTNTPNGRVYRFCSTLPIVGINEFVENMPNNYSLSQNYPNPFNPTTVISFGIPKAGNVKLVVYDILGRTVSTLINEFKQAGNYNAGFDGSNLSSGVYFYKLEAGDYIANKKMLLVK